MIFLSHYSVVLCPRGQPLSVCVPVGSFTKKSGISGVGRHFFSLQRAREGTAGSPEDRAFFLLYFSMFVICFVFSSCSSLCSQVYLEFQSPDQNHQIVQTRP